MPNEFIHFMAPEVIGLSPQKVWNGPWTANYPSSFEFGFISLLADVDPIRKILGEILDENNIIPSQGKILDIGCGPNTDSVFGEAITKNRIWGIDFAPNQLEKSLIPPQRRIVADVTTADVSQLGLGNFDLISILFLSRYLTADEALNLYRQSKAIGETIVIAEHHTTKDMFKEVLGQKREFELEEEKGLIKAAGFSQINTHLVKIQFPDRVGKISLIWGN